MMICQELWMIGCQGTCPSVYMCSARACLSVYSCYCLSDCPFLSKSSLPIGRALSVFHVCVCLILSLDMCVFSLSLPQFYLITDLHISFCSFDFVFFVYRLLFQSVHFTQPSVYVSISERYFLFLHVSLSFFTGTSHVYPLPTYICPLFYVPFCISFFLSLSLSHSTLLFRLYLCLPKYYSICALVCLCLSNRLLSSFAFLDFAFCLHTSSSLCVSFIFCCTCS